MPSAEERRRVAVLTSGRADLGPLGPVIAALDADPRVDLTVLATGTHLVGSRGDSLGDIELSAASTLRVIDAGMEASAPDALARSFGAIASGVSDALVADAVDAVVVLGDRWELLAVAAATLLHGTPLVHLHGGETTEGAIDDRVRHALTKLADLHLCATEDGARRIRQLGEDPQRIVVTGAPGIDRLSARPVTDDELGGRLGVEVRRPFGLFAYHPTTIDRSDLRRRARQVADGAAGALATVVAVLPGADPGADEIIEELYEAERRHPNFAVRPHLGPAWVEAMTTADVLVGNSSSGICEAASFELPVVDVGDRQRGRLRPMNVVHADETADAVGDAVAAVLAPEFRTQLTGMVNPYGDGRASGRIVDAILAQPRSRMEAKPFVESAGSEAVTALEPLCVPPSASLREAMAAIDGGARAIALVVDDDGRLVGTVTDGDVRRAILGGAGVDDPVLPHVARVPVVARQGAPAAELLALMRSSSVSQLPIVDDDGRLVGLHLLRSLIDDVLDQRP